jgi:putative colanic acid biosynthesis acetyltransferase WcaF
LIASPIAIEPECWVAARAFVGPGVRIGRGAVVGACSLLLSDVQPGTIVAGAPARAIGTRKVRNAESIHAGKGVRVPNGTGVWIAPP